MSQVVSSKTSLVLRVTKQMPELIAPAEATPFEFKEISVIDNQQGVRHFVPGVQFYRAGPSNGPDPVKVIKEALRKALVSYYPLAGRLREKEGNRLVVECNGEGILFVEADADVTLADFGIALSPPFPFMEELLDDCYTSGPIVDCPMLSIQVTRLICGGFILAHKMNHVVVDGSGLAQFMHGVAELARGAKFLSVEPVWERHLLQARNPPQVTHVHREYDQDDNIINRTIAPLNDVVQMSFVFGPTEMAAIRRLLPAHLKSSTTFEVLLACIWRSRTIAMQLDPNEEARVRFYVNARHKLNPPLPTGYYGNIIAAPVAISTAYDLSSNPLGYALELIKSAKANITEDYMKSLTDFIVVKGGPHFTKASAGTYVVSNVSRVGLDQWDFGWGKAVFGGPAKVWVGGPTPGFGNFFLAGKNGLGESGILVPMFLPRLAMDRFVEELNGYLSVGVSEQPVAFSGSSIYGTTKAMTFVKGTGAAVFA